VNVIVKHAINKILSQKLDCVVGIVYVSSMAALDWL